MEITYECLGGLDYRFTVKRYINCSSTIVENASSGSIQLSVKSATCGQNYNVQIQYLSGATEVTQYTCGLVSICDEGGTEYGVYEIVYQSDIVLPLACTDWVFSHTLVYRNSITTRDADALYVESFLNNVDAWCNSSPSFSDIPVVQAFKDIALTYDLSGTDTDGDDITYVLTSPLQAVGLNVSYKPGYLTEPFGSAAPIPSTSLNGSNGFLEVTPKELLTTQLAVRVEERRSGVLIGYVLRDVQVDVATYIGCLEVNLTGNGVSCAAPNSGSVIVMNSIEFPTYLWSNGATTSGIQNLASGTYTVTVTDLFTGFQDVESYTVGTDACHCCSQFPVPGLGVSGTKFSQIGEFFLDENTGSINYQLFSCGDDFSPYTCISLGPDHTLVNLIPLTDVVSASAVTFFDDWAYEDQMVYGLNDNSPDLNLIPNLFESGKRGKWRPESQYVYRKDIDNMDKTVLDNYKNYDRGTFQLTLFDWSNDIDENIGVNDPNQWVLTSTTTKYSPNGEPLEDENILGIKSTAKYGYNNTLPVLVAQNAEEGTVVYEGFENLYSVGTSSVFDDGLLYLSTDGTRAKRGQLIASQKAKSHTGNFSIALKPGKTTLVGKLILSTQSLADGLLVKTWVHVNPNKPEPDDRIDIELGINTYSDVLPMVKISTAGEWALYESVITPTVLNDLVLGFLGFDPTVDRLVVGVDVDFTADLSLDQYVEGDVFVDDVRIQPLQSEMVCYVYDSAQRLTAVLDDQHYAMIYQYNSEGILVRKLKETVEGVKTISETQYNTQGDFFR